jgi:hypothetical protein
LGGTFGELTAHPIVRREADYLMSDEFHALLQALEIGGYALL